MRKFAAFMIILVFGIALAFLLAALMAFPVMWLWNYAAVSVFHVERLDFWHALALNMLFGILVRGVQTAQKKAE